MSTMPATSPLDSLPSTYVLVEENLQAIAQLKALLSQMDRDTYCHVFEGVGAPTLGKHTRHIIDHYMALLKPENEQSNDTINYEHRQREVALEQCPKQALQCLEMIGEDLKALSRQASITSVQIAYPTGDSTLMLRSSLGRELAFLTSHSIHHMATLALLAKTLGLSIPKNFGVHPSTLRHWQRQMMAEEVSHAS